MERRSGALDELLGEYARGIETRRVGVAAQSPGATAALSELVVPVVLRLPALLPTGTRETFEELPVGVGATIRIVPLFESLP